MLVLRSGRADTDLAAAEDLTVQARAAVILPCPGFATR